MSIRCSLWAALLCSAAAVARASVPPPAAAAAAAASAVTATAALWAEEQEGAGNAASLLQTSSHVSRFSRFANRGGVSLAALADLGGGGLTADPTVAAAAAPAAAPAAGGDDPSRMPLNSAAERHGPFAVADRLALAASLILPCVVFLGREWMLSRPTQDSGGSAMGRQMSGSEHGQTMAPSENSPPAAAAAAEATLAKAQNQAPRSGSFRSLRDQERFQPQLLMSQQEEGTMKSALSGAVIALGCLPEAISFSMIVGISPLNGIWAGVFMGLYSSLLGGRPGMVSCSSAATAVVLGTFVHDFGMGPMALCVVLCGLWQLLAGALYLSRFIALVPHPVMLGFVNGLAIVIARAQLRQFREHGDGEWVEVPVMIGMLLTVLVSMATAMAAPRIPVIGRLLPGPLVAIVCAIGFSCAISPWFPQRTLAQAAGEATFAGGPQSLPSWNFPPQGVDWSSSRMWMACFLCSIRMALVGLVESLLTVKLLDGLTGTPGSTRRECFGQGLGNIVAGMFGTQGGCALIGQSLINVSGGGTTRLSGFVMSMGLALSVVLLAPQVGRIPVAALVGLMFLVSINTFAWGSLGLLTIIAWTDALVIVTVTLVTVFVDLATAVLIGLFISALGFAWSSAREVRLVDEPVDDSTRVFRLQGPLFFGSAMSFQSRVRAERIPEPNVVLDFSRGRVLDHSGLDAITKAVEKLQEAGKKVECRSLPQDASEYLRSMSVPVSVMDDKLDSLKPPAADAPDSDGAAAHADDAAAAAAAPKTAAT